MTQRITDLASFQVAVCTALAVLVPELQPRMGPDGRIDLTHPDFADLNVGTANAWRYYTGGMPFQEVIGFLLKGLKDAMESDHILRSWASAAPAVRLLLDQPGKLAHAEEVANAHQARRPPEGRTPPTVRLLTRPYDFGLALAVGVDLGDSVAYVTNGQAEDWQIDEPAIWVAAYANTLAAERARLPRVTHRRGWRLRVWSGFGAAVRLALDELWDFGRRWGYLVVPHRHLIAEVTTTKRRPAALPLGFLAAILREEGDDNNALLPDGAIRVANDGARDLIDFTAPREGGP